MNKTIEAIREVEGLMFNMDEDEKQAFLQNILKDSGCIHLGFNKDDIEQILMNLLPAYEKATGKEAD